MDLGYNETETRGSLKERWLTFGVHITRWLETNSPTTGSLNNNNNRTEVYWGSGSHRRRRRESLYPLDKIKRHTALGFDWN